MLSGADKTALLLLLLDEPEAAGLLARLEPHEVEQIGRAMLNVADASPHTIDQVLGEVLDAAREIVAVGEGAPTVRDLLGRALGDERAGGILERLGEEARALSISVDTVQDIVHDAGGQRESAAEFIDRERPFVFPKAVYDLEHDGQDDPASSVVADAERFALFGETVDILVGEREFAAEEQDFPRDLQP